MSKRGDVKALAIIVLVMLSVTLGAELYHQNTYFSGVLDNNMRSVRLRATGAAPSILSKTGSGVVSTPMQSLQDGYDTWQGTIQNPVHPYLGYKQDSDSTDTIIPVHYSGTAMPALNDLTPCVSDPAGDEMFSISNLDIVNSFVTASDDKFYFGIVNNGGGFPTSNGFTFFSYMAVIIDPATVNDPDPVVWGLMYTVEVTGVIAPGLFRVTGQTTSDMLRLGDIETQVIAGSNLLLLSCQKSDLLADTLFAAWYDQADPELAGIFMTNKITLSSGVQVADETEGYNLRDVVIPVPQEAASTPVLTNAAVTQGPDWNYHFDVDYSSMNSYFPVEAELEIDGNYVCDMHYNSFPDFSDAVHYTAAVDAITIGNWQSAGLRFSVDGINYTVTMLNNTSLEDEPATGTPAVLLHRMYPNPARDKVFLEISKDCRTAEVELFNLKGQKLMREELFIDKGIAGFDLSKNKEKTSNGLYLVRISDGQRSQTAKLLISR